MYFRYSPRVLGNNDKIYRAMVYADGKYKKVKTYICIDPSPFYEADGKPVFVIYGDTYEQLYAYDKGHTINIEDLKYYNENGELIDQT